MTRVFVILTGLAVTALGVWLHRRLRAAASEYRRAGQTSGERVARDMTFGRALMHAWVLVLLGAVTVGYGLYLLAQETLR